MNDKSSERLDGIDVIVNQLRYALSMCGYHASRIKKRNQGGFIGDIDDCDQIINRVSKAMELTIPESVKRAAEWKEKAVADW